MRNLRSRLARGLRCLGLAVFSAGALLPAGASGQGMTSQSSSDNACGMTITVTGTVTRNGTPCLRAFVSVNGVSTFTDASGNYAVTVPLANLTIFAQWISTSFPVQVWNKTTSTGALCGGTQTVDMALNRIR